VPRAERMERMELGEASVPEDGRARRVEIGRRRNWRPQLAAMSEPA